MSYTLDTPFSNQVIFLTTQNAIIRNIDGQGSEYQYNFQTPIQVQQNCQLLISITDAQLPNIMPNISSFNNKISFFIPTFSKYFTITIIDSDGSVNKNYNVNSFLSFVNDKISIESNSQFNLYGYYDENNAKIIWYCNYKFQIINTSNYPTTCLSLIGGEKDQFNNYIYYDDDNKIILNSITNPSYHINMPSCVNFSNTRFIFLKFKNITIPNMNSVGLLDNSIIRINNNAPFGYYIFYRPNDIQRFLITKRNITNIAFRLTDMDNNDLNIWSNDAQITIKLETIYNPELKTSEEGTIVYELRKLNKNFPIQDELKGKYNPENNEFLRE
jgi:hypothetical protein